MADELLNWEWLMRRGFRQENSAWVYDLPIDHEDEEMNHCSLCVVVGSGGDHPTVALHAWSALGLTITVLKSLPQMPTCEHVERLLIGLGADKGDEHG